MFKIFESVKKHVYDSFFAHFEHGKKIAIMDWRNVLNLHALVRTLETSPSSSWSVIKICNVESYFCKIKNPKQDNEVRFTAHLSLGKVLVGKIYSFGPLTASRINGTLWNKIMKSDSQLDLALGPWIGSGEDFFESSIPFLIYSSFRISNLSWTQ